MRLFLVNYFPLPLTRNKLFSCLSKEDSDRGRPAPWQNYVFPPHLVSPTNSPVSLLRWNSDVSSLPGTNQIQHSLLSSLVIPETQYWRLPLESKDVIGFELTYKKYPYHLRSQLESSLFQIYQNFSIWFFLCQIILFIRITF